MSGAVNSLPTTGAGSAVAGTVGVFSVLQGSLLMLAFTCLIIGIHVLNMGRLEYNARRLRKRGQLD